MQISVRSSQLSLDFNSNVKPGQTLLAALVHQESRDCSRLGVLEIRYQRVRLHTFSLGTLGKVPTFRGIPKRDPIRYQSNRHITLHAYSTPARHQLANGHKGREEACRCSPSRPTRRLMKRAPSLCRHGSSGKATEADCGHLI